jgi:hypothetical protein
MGTLFKKMVKNLPIYVTRIATMKVANSPEKATDAVAFSLRLGLTSVTYTLPAQKIVG